MLFGSKAGALTLTDKSYMAPINFDKHCASCHPLQFDRRISEPAPHDKQPQEVYDFMVAKLTAYIAAHPAEIPLVDEPDKRLPSRPPQPPARNAAEWVQQRMEDAQLLMWRKACKECHTMNYPNGADALPMAASLRLTTRWLPHSEFDHTAHQMVNASCHEKATESRNRGRADPGHRELPAMPPSGKDRGSAVFRVPRLSRLEQRKTGRRKVHD